MKMVVAQITKSCDTCLQNNPRTVLPPPPLFRPIQHQGNNKEKWQIDFTQMPKSRGHKYLLVKVDTVTGWVETFPTWTEKITPSFRLPQYIPNDNEPLPDLKTILGKWFGFSRSWLKFWNRNYEASVFVCSYVSIQVLKR